MTKTRSRDTYTSNLPEALILYLFEHKECSLIEFLFHYILYLHPTRRINHKSLYAIVLTEFNPDIPFSSLTGRMADLMSTPGMTSLLSLQKETGLNSKEYMYVRRDTSKESIIAFSDVQDHLKTLASKGNFKQEENKQAKVCALQNPLKMAINEEDRDFKIMVSIAKNIDALLPDTVKICLLLMSLPKFFTATDIAIGNCLGVTSCQPRIWEFVNALANHPEYIGNVTYVNSIVRIHIDPSEWHMTTEECIALINACKKQTTINNRMMSDIAESRTSAGFGFK